MAAVLILTPYLFPTPKPLPGSTPVAADTLRDSLRDTAAADAAARLAAGAATNTAASAAAGSAGGVAGDSLAPAAVAVDTTIVKTALADYRTSNRGASLVGATMTRYQALSTKAAPVAVRWNCRRRATGC